MWLSLVELAFAQKAQADVTGLKKRLALVMGNAEYGKGNSLANPTHDAEDVSKRLKALGFDVVTLMDGGLREMDDAVSDIGEKARDYGVTLIYYSGHGLQAKGENFLVPVDAELKSEADVRYKCLNLNLLLDRLEESGCPMNIVVLDACRNNPFTKGWYRGEYKQGLASVSPPKGTYITFSTAAGSVALDGTGRNSPYTTAFLETLEEPNLSLFDFFNEVGMKVLVATNNEQDPWTNHNTMRGRFVFNEVAITPVPPVDTPAPLASTPSYRTDADVDMFPKWLDTKGQNFYLGVSAPMADRAAARRQAIVSAMLSFLHNQGGADVSLISKHNITNEQDSQGKASSGISFALKETFLLDRLRVDILNCSYNKNNECFVLCHIERSESPNTTLLVKRQMSSDLKQNQLKFSASAYLDNKKTTVDYNMTIDPFAGTMNRLLIDSVSIPLFQLDYEDATLVDVGKSSSFYGTKISTYGSLGMTQLALLAQLPAIPRVMQIHSFSEITTESKQQDSHHVTTTENFICNTTYFADSTSNQALPITFTSIKNNCLGISIKDPYPLFPAAQKSQGVSKAEKTMSKQTGIPIEFYSIYYKKHQEEEFSAMGRAETEPVLLGKTISLYAALLDIAQKRESQRKQNPVQVHSTTEVMGPSKRGVSSMNTSVPNLKNFYPFFFMDGTRMNLDNNDAARKQIAVIMKAETGNK